MKKKDKLYLALIAVVASAIAAVLVLSFGNAGSKAELPALTPRPKNEVVVKEVPKIIHVEKQISAETIEEGINDIGIMLTDEYYFTELVSYSSAKKLFSTELKFTQSSYLASYDGVISAGIDFSKVRVTKDDTSKLISLEMPRSEIKSIDIDPESFTLYSEKAGFSNPVSAADFNQSLIELENTAVTRAIDRGVLQRADENAKTLIRNFIASLVDLDDYRIEYIEI